jgi:hypothetical protein
MVAVGKIWSHFSGLPPCSVAHIHTIDDIGILSLFGDEVDRIEIPIHQLHIWVIGGHQFTLGAVANQCRDLPIWMGLFDGIQRITADIACDASTPRLSATSLFVQCLQPTRRSWGP